jgi:hypothetical protein
MAEPNIEIRLLDLPETKKLFKDYNEELNRLHVNLVEWQDRALKAEDKLANDGTVKQCRKLRDQIKQMNLDHALTMDRALIAEEKLAKLYKILEECVR